MNPDGWKSSLAGQSFVITALCLLSFLTCQHAVGGEPAVVTDEAADPTAAEGTPTIDEQAAKQPNAFISGIESELEEILSIRPADLVRAERRIARQQAQLPNTIRRLTSIVSRCKTSANWFADANDERLKLLNLQARALAELSRLDQRPPQPAKEPGEQADPLQEQQAGDIRGRDWLIQLREVAERIERIDLPRAMPIADYWWILAEIAGLSDDEESNQARTVQLLKDYVEQHQDNPAAIEWVADMRLSLAQLLDQRGDQVGAAQQLGALGDLPPQSPRYEQTQPIRERIARTGIPVAFEGVTTTANRWAVSDHTGSPVLLHIYADSVEPSVALIESIQKKITEQSLGGFSIASLRVGDAVPNQAAPPWPIVPIDLEKDGLLDQLGIDALPTLLWLDHEGRLVSMGSGIAVLDQMPAIPEPGDPVEAADEVEPIAGENEEK